MFSTDVRVLRENGAHLSVDAPGLTIMATVGALSSRVVLHGDLDSVTAPALDVVIERSLAAGPPRLEIDLAELTFLGVAGITALQQAHCACVARNGRVVLERASTHVRKVLRILGCDNLLG